MPAYSSPTFDSRPGEVAGTLRLLAYLALAIALIFLDTRGGWLQRARAQAGLAVQPLWWVAGLPGRLGNTLRDDAATHAQLIKENRALRNELLLANARLTRFATASADNAHLRELLGAAQRDELKVQLAPVLNIDLDPTRQRLVLDAGSNAGIHAGQTVIDAGGLMGQIIEVRPMHATVLLLTDPDHAVPVMVERSGVRLIAYGRGRSDRLELTDIPRNADIKVGDRVISSGLGQRFPAGFLVGTVTALHPDESHAFLIGDLKPAAQLDRGRDVLLLTGGQPKLAQPAGSGTQDPGLGNGAGEIAVDAAASASPGGRGLGVRVSDDANAGTENVPAAGDSNKASSPQAAASSLKRTLAPTPLPPGEGLKPTASPPASPDSRPSVPAEARP